MHPALLAEHILMAVRDKYVGRTYIDGCTR